MPPDWQPRDLAGALAAAANNGWPWPRAFLATARLLADPDATPRDLLAEIASPLERNTRPLSPAANARHAAEAKVRLDESLARGARGPATCGTAGKISPSSTPSFSPTGPSPTSPSACPAPPGPPPRGAASPPRRPPAPAAPPPRTRR